jgi:uncharacterized membrane protein YvbJ
VQASFIEKEVSSRMAKAKKNIKSTTDTDWASIAKIVIVIFDIVKAILDRL